MHGGPSQFHFHSGYLASKYGFFAISVDYRLSGEAQFPAALHDSKCAVRWARSQAEERNIDPDRLCVAGGSARGAHRRRTGGGTERRAGQNRMGFPPHLLFRQSQVRAGLLSRRGHGGATMSSAGIDDDESDAPEAVDVVVPFRAEACIIGDIVFRNSLALAVLMIAHAR